VLVAALLAAAAVHAEPAPYRYQAPIAVDAPAPFIQLALPIAAYGHVEQDDLRDLRIVDAKGERVPFAVLPSVATVQLSEQVREASLYPLPARPTAGGAWPSPVDVVVDGDRITVHRRGGIVGTLAAAPRESGGWLIDTGETRRGEPPPRRLTLRWSGPAEFSVAYRIETSDDLRQWRAAGSGQLMALQSARGTLAQPVVVLPESTGRFVRLVWAEPGAAPALTGAIVLVAERQRVAVDSTRELTVAPSPEPALTASTQAAARALHFDLGGVLPLVDVDLRFDAGTHVAPVRLQGRARTDQPWREVGSGVFYRLERGGEVGNSPPLAVPVTLRYLRLVPDERAASLDGVGAQLVVHASLASIVFAAQGEPPFRLLAGSPDAAAAALPVGAVVPQLDSERARFGRATLGAFAVDEAAARVAEQASRQARLRPWLLWSVLIVGVVGLGALVWRLARSGPAPGPATSPPG
jgi:hypothetical protein